MEKGTQQCLQEKTLRAIHYFCANVFSINSGCGGNCVCGGSVVGGAGYKVIYLGVRVGSMC